MENGRIRAQIDSFTGSELSTGSLRYSWTDSDRDTTVGVIANATGSMLEKMEWLLLFSWQREVRERSSKI